MKLQFHFKHLTDALKEDIKNYGNEKFQHLETFLHSFPEDNKMLKVDVEHHEKHNQYELKATLTLGGKHIHHEENTHDPREAIDKTEANLIRQAKKHIELMREHPHIEVIVEENE